MAHKTLIKLSTNAGIPALGLGELAIASKTPRLDKGRPLLTACEAHGNLRKAKSQLRYYMRSSQAIGISTVRSATRMRTK